jgi:hypothetical protein
MAYPPRRAGLCVAALRSGAAHFGYRLTTTIPYVHNADIIECAKSIFSGVFIIFSKFAI